MMVEIRGLTYVCTLVIMNDRLNIVKLIYYPALIYLFINQPKQL